jgi:hypothetical protein
MHSGRGGMGEVCEGGGKSGGAGWREWVEGTER